MEFKIFNDKSNQSLCIECTLDNVTGYIVLDHNRNIIEINSLNNDIKSALLDKAILYAKDEMISYCGEPLLLESKGFTLAEGYYIYKRDLYDFKCYDEVQEFISKQKDRVYSLDNFKKIMNDYCNPQNALQCIHIGGTNGKGSTVNYIRSVLNHAGYKIGTFTSPALVNRREVIRINNIPISESDIISIANRYMYDWLKYEISIFEIEMFISIIYFIENCIDYAVYEVGLGGELDATNVIHSIVSAITNIGLDHIEYLGNDYCSIARTKAGIIKENSCFFTNESKDECLDIFKNVCLNKHTIFNQVQKPTNLYVGDMLEFDYKNYHIKLATKAIYQNENCILALEILSYLKAKNYVSFSDNIMLEGLMNAVWAGRFETVHDNPLIIIDGAHNEAGMNAFIESIKGFSNIKVIFSALKDKDTDKMMELLLSACDDVTVCEFDFYRAQKAELLASDFPVNIEKDWKKAVDDCYLHNGTVFITGSLYFIAQVRDYILNKKTTI